MSEDNKKNILIPGLSQKPNIGELVSNSSIKDRLKSFLPIISQAPLPENQEANNEIVITDARIIPEAESSDSSSDEEDSSVETKSGKKSNKPVKNEKTVVEMNLYVPEETNEKQPKKILIEEVNDD
uniref:Uncharacterized protein n=1 Tax=Rhabditophanes sp. KR3021 TaxID=114890 RepID=A0AC35UH27_9BILA